MFNFIAKLFGTKSERDLKALWPYVDRIRAAFEPLAALSHDALREATQQLKHQIQGRLQATDQAIEALKNQANQQTDQTLAQREKIFEQIALYQDKRHKELEAALEEALPKAFAIMKETARRFKEHDSLSVTAQDFDQELATHQAHITLEGNQAIWQSSWQAGGSLQTWDMIHYDVQLLGGVILHQGKIAEMATGEGKTLVATLPAFLNALGGVGVHIITVNDYLAKRDAAWMGPLYAFHGLRVDCIDEHPAHSPARQRAYQADITYGTNNEFGFDYLRDNMVNDTDELVQRGHHFAMVDEVDSVLIDDARTPLIISGPVAKGNEQEYQALKPRIQQLYMAQRQLANQLLQEAKQKIADKDLDTGGLALFRAYRGLPKHKPLIKYLSEEGMQQLLLKVENTYLQENAARMPEADAPLLFTIDERRSSVELTDKGIDYITQSDEDASLFVLPDISAAIAQIDNDETLNTQEKTAKKEQISSDYVQKSQKIHVVHQLLKAYTLFEKDVEYIVADGAVKIVDEQTGRILEGRRYSDGVHQAIEAKEAVRIKRISQTYATITLQNYFRMYHKLAGMTGTAETEAGEFWDIYKLDVIVTPTNRPVRREDRDDKVYKTTREKFNAVIEEIHTLVAQKRPVLVGTTSVEISELVSRMLAMRKLKHQVLNAKYHQKEAEIVAEAGKPGTITIATNMAGRGTDIKLTSEAKEAGGLAIIGTERHESRRVDRQLRGRAGRQGDVGSSQFFSSLEDSLMRLFGSDRIARLMDRMGLKEGEVIQHKLITRSIEKAQQKVEQNNFASRKNLLEYDDVMNAQREVIYERRKQALSGHRLQLDVMHLFYDVAMRLQEVAQNDTEGLKEELSRTYGITLETTEKSATDVAEVAYQIAWQQYQTRKKELTSSFWKELNNLQTLPPDFVLPFSDGQTNLQVFINTDECAASEGKLLGNALEQATLLYFIDKYWKEHLREMDDLKQSVQSAVYEQKSPLVVYKLEGLGLFQQFVHRVNLDALTFLNRVVALPPKAQEVRTMQPRIPDERLKLQESKPSVNASDMQSVQPVARPAKSQKIANRNQRVTVRYADGTIKKDIKFKAVEEDVRNERCVLVDV